MTTATTSLDRPRSPCSRPAVTSPSATCSARCARWPPSRQRADCFYGISDLHALTTPHDPAALRDRIREQATLLLAAGLDEQHAVRAEPGAGAQPARPTCSSAGDHRRAEPDDPVQGEGPRAGESTRTSLLTYPALMAADILLYRPAQVPVGDDQRQHVELTRDLALRFNSTYGQVFTVPEVTTPPAGARVMRPRRADPQDVQVRRTGRA